MLFGDFERMLQFVLFCLSSVTYPVIVNNKLPFSEIMYQAQIFEASSTEAGI